MKLIEVALPLDAINDARCTNLAGPEPGPLLTLDEMLAEALACSGLVPSWPEIVRPARESPAATCIVDRDLFDDIP